MSDASVRQWLLTHTPLEPSLLEGPGFRALVAERVASVADGIESVYVNVLDQRPDEAERLIADISVPETWLFRYPNSFELLADVLRRRLANGSASLRMCSIGCAMGQEPYGMAITALHAGWSADRVRIDAFDRNPEALKVAGIGRYGTGSIRSEIPTWVAEHLEHDSGEVRIGAHIRGMVRFAQADVTSTSIAGPFDVTFCRNVMIYLNSDARTHLVRAICETLVPGGVLFVGHAEQFLRTEPLLRPIASSHAFALQRIDAAALVPEAPARPALAMPRPFAAPPPPPPRAPIPTPRNLPPQRVDSLDEARDLADAGRMRESEAMIRSIMTRRGPSAPALELLGIIRLAADDATEAKRLFEQAVYLEPARSASLLQLAMLSERANDLQRASTYWERARRAAAHVAQEPTR